jgi:hypothetical protein
MPDKDPINIVYVLLFFNEGNSREYGLETWKILGTSRYTYKRYTDATYNRLYVTTFVQSLSFFDRYIPDMRRMFADSDASGPRPDEQVSLEISPVEVTGRNLKTYDQKKIARVLRERLPQVKSSDCMIVMTDQSITPPKEWRYILWSAFKDAGAWNAVISMAPMDPRYWRDSNSERVKTLTSRAQAANLAVTGSLLGLERCENSECFLFSDVNSVLVLDDMRGIGPEHDSDLSAGVKTEQTRQETVANFYRAKA